MRKLLTLTFIFTLLFDYIIAQQPNLPHWMTKSETATLPNYLLRENITRGTNPPAWEPRAMAEWDEIQGLLVTWTDYTSIIRQIIDAAQEECTVYIVCNDSNSVKSTLQSNGIPLYNLKFFEWDYDSVWSRDYGQWNIYRNDVEELSLVDWIYNRPRPNDDVIPEQLAPALNVPFYSMTQAPNDLVHTGGNFMVDGHGTGFSSKLILEENGVNNDFSVSVKDEQDIDNIMHDYLGLDRYILMETLPYDEIHHIDMHMKLLDEETLLVGEFPAGVADGPQIEDNIQYITDNFLSCYGRPYKIVNIPMPPSTSGNYVDNNAYYRTYTNSVFVNKTIIVPTYREEYDTTAIRIYKENCPGYKIVSIDCDDGSAPIISALGAIHCITKEVGQSDPVWIDHAPLQNTADYINDYLVEAKIKSPSGIADATMFWTIDTTAGYASLAMSPAVTDTFYAYIPAQPAGTKIFYYINATSNSGRNVSKPLTAPEGWMEFEVVNVTGSVSIPNPAIELMDVYPNPSNSAVNFGFVLPQSMKCDLTVSDILGRTFVVIKDELFSMGDHKISFDVSLLASGIYTVQLKTGLEVLSKNFTVAH